MKMCVCSNGVTILTAGNPKYFEKNLPQCHSVQHKTYKDHLESNPGLLVTGQRQTS